MRYLLVLLALTGCVGNQKPDPLAPTVLTDVRTVEVPVPVQRKPPPELLSPLGLQAPMILPAGQGDYGISRADLELMIDAHRSAAERLARWKAWASP